ncbi:hypothetical protein BofuT4_uP076760.1 [Botrytis cinerea T4]|uniref:Uncharacterized protein n=1 Tax=Botryotinia fuckeliana (strain T4) TaxID=999810 RepID=G2XNY7_BOTF4|nr:hypothetical protein BofuT4_uP076760.1 [Botrytis cinerea T4]
MSDREFSSNDDLSLPKESVFDFAVSFCFTWGFGFIKILV